MGEQQIRELEDQLGVAIKPVHAEGVFAFNTDPVTVQQKRAAQQKLKLLGYEFKTVHRPGNKFAKRAWVKA